MVLVFNYFFPEMCTVIKPSQLFPQADMMAVMGNLRNLIGIPTISLLPGNIRKNI
jgi:hypothetical protein